MLRYYGLHNRSTGAPEHRSTVVGVVIATRWEARDILRRFAFRRLERNLYRAEVANHPVLLVVSGVGKDAARRASMRLCDQGAGELISMGFCGALTSDLKVGDLVTDRIATASGPVRNRQERETLTRRANAVACDMETQTVIESGTRRGVPIRVLRVVSDTVDDDLTPLFGRDAGFSPFRMAVRLLNPEVWPLAAQLRRHSRLAAKKLADALGEYLS